VDKPGGRTARAAPRSIAVGSGVTLGQLRVFGAVAEREHLTRAAKALRMSQASVSTHVRRLERALGSPLLHRVGRNVRLTDFGHSLRPLAREVVERAEAIDDLARGFLQAEHGTVRVAAGAVIGAHRLGSWLGPFVSEHPRIEMRIAVASMLEALDGLRRGDLDVAIQGTSMPEPASDLESIDLVPTELVIVVGAGHPLASVADPLVELAGHRYLVHGHGSATQLVAEAVLASQIDGAARVEMD